MLTRLLSLLLIFAANVLTFGAECHGAKASSFSADEYLLSPVTLLEAAADRAPPGEQDSSRDTETENQTHYNNCLPYAELHGSVSEKFDSSFGESMVLHLVAQTTGKLLPLARIDQQPRTPSLVRLSVMLQV